MQFQQQQEAFYLESWDRDGDQESQEQSLTQKAMDAMQSYYQEETEGQWY